MLDQSPYMHENFHLIRLLRLILYKPFLWVQCLSISSHSLLKLVNLVTLCFLVLCIIYEDHPMVVLFLCYGLRLLASSCPRVGLPVCPSAGWGYTCKLRSVYGNNGEGASADVRSHLISNKGRTTKEGSTSCSEDIPITGNVPNKHQFSL